MAKIRWQDANHGVGIIVDTDSLAKNVGVGTKASPSNAILEDGHGGVARNSILSAKDTA